MSVGRSIVEIEGQRGILQILLVLKENGDMLYANLYNNPALISISNNSTAKRALEILLKHNLIIQKGSKNRRATYYSLTSKGKRFTRHISEMQKLIEQQ